MAARILSFAANKMMADQMCPAVAVVLVVAMVVVVAVVDIET